MHALCFPVTENKYFSLVLKGCFKYFLWTTSVLLKESVIAPILMGINHLTGHTTMTIKTLDLKESWKMLFVSCWNQKPALQVVLFPSEQPAPTPLSIWSSDLWKAAVLETEEAFQLSPWFKWHPLALKGQKAYSDQQVEVKSITDIYAFS